MPKAEEVTQPVTDIKEPVIITRNLEIKMGDGEVLIIKDVNDYKIGTIEEEKVLEVLWGGIKNHTMIPYSLIKYFSAYYV